MLTLLTLAFSIISVLSRQSPVSWDVNPLLNSGQHKVVNGFNTSSGPIQVPQTFNASFSYPPRVILSFEGYQQSVCPQCNVGFICNGISNITSLGFRSNFVLHGSVTIYLYYMYLGISHQAVQYFTSENLISFPNSSGLVDINSTLRGQYLSFSRNQLTNITNSDDFKQIVFLSGFKMNVGNNGTYINFTYQMNSTDYSISVSTIGDVQIYQISYFRLAYNKVKIEKGFISFIDIFSFEGVDSKQKQTVSNVTGLNFKYRNFLMGFNKINIPLSTNSVQVNILMQISYPPQTIYTFSLLQAVRQYSIYPTYSYVLADIFHHRKRVCIQDPYFHLQSQRCFDNCPSRYFQQINQTYCESCHFSCFQCIQTTPLDCVSCSEAEDFRVLNQTNNISCICKQGYFQKNISVCGRCQAYCNKCEDNSYFCTECKVNQNRELNLTNNSCVCMQGFYENSNYEPLICLSCDTRCQTCLNSNFCTLCDQSGKKRQLISNKCQCIEGFYERFNSTNYTFCEICHERCLSCSKIESNCTSCNQSKKLVLNLSNSCICNNTYYQVVLNNQLSCFPCHPTCYNCFNSSFDSCVSCFSNQKRTLNTTNSTCQCAIGYFQISLRTPQNCIPCNSTCQSCQIISSNCSSCYSHQNRRLFSFQCICTEGFFEINQYTPQICISCNSTCKTCQGSGDFCLSCYAIQNRILNTNTHKCQCQVGLIESILDTNYCDYQICGNGIKQGEQGCDDYNNANGDGCSSTCTIQASHSCTNFSNQNGTSLCYFSDNILMQILSVVKIINDNKISAIIKVSAALCNMEKLKTYLQSLSALQYQESNIRILNKIEKRFLQARAISISKATFLLSNETKYEGYLQLMLDYSQSIQTLYNKKIKFISSNQENELKYFFRTPEASAKLKDPDNNVPIIFFKTETYQTVNGISYAFLVVSLLCLAYFLVGVILRKSVIPLENILVFQFAYFCVIGQNKVLLSLSGLAFYGRYTTGLNVDILKTITSEQQGIIHYNVCQQMGKIYQQCNSIDNINVTFFIGMSLLFYILGSQIYKKWIEKKLNDNKGTKSKGSAKSQMIQNSDYQSDSQKSSVTQGGYIYELPKRIQLSIQISLQFVSGIFFMTDIEFLSTAVNLSTDYLTSSIVWLCFVAMFFAIFWAYYYYLYPIKNYSYRMIMKHRFERFALQKHFYFILFALLFAWGGLVSSSTVSGIVSYIVLVIWSILWGFFTVKKEIYRNKRQTIRVIVNQILIFFIGLLFIISEYAPSDGLGLGYAIVILIFLFVSLINNIFFQVLDECKLAKGQKEVNDEEEFKNVEQQYRSNAAKKQQPQGDRYFATNKLENAFELTSPKMKHRRSDEESQSKQSIIRSKELQQIKRNIRKQLGQQDASQQDSQRAYKNFKDNQINQE